MKTDRVKGALQDLIYRLQDAEKGYKEIVKASSNPVLRKWLNKYADERHHMHRTLENLMKGLGGEPEVNTTILGDLHRLFIDLKINNTSLENEYDAVVTEIERGASTLVNEYTRILEEVAMPANYASVLIQQKSTIEAELESLVELKEEFNSTAV